MSAFVIFEKNAIFCFFVSDFRQFSVTLKIASRLPVIVFEACFGLNSLQGLQLTTNTKQVTYHCFGRKNIWTKNSFYQILERCDFRFLHPNRCKYRIF